MKYRKIAVLVLFLLLCTGCGRAAEKAPSVGVVSEITVTREHRGMVTRQIYTEPHKLQQILNALRQVGQRFTPDTDPETLPLSSFHITLHRTDGIEHIYRTKADRYIRYNRQPWQETDPESLSRLTELLQNLPGDVPEISTRRGIPRSMDWLIGLRYGTSEWHFRTAAQKTSAAKRQRLSFERNKNYS